MTACKRVAKELEDLQKDLPRYLRNLSSDDADVLVWHALLLPLIEGKEQFPKLCQPQSVLQTFVISRRSVKLASTQVASEKPPYNLGAFNLRINFPEEYPLRPPTVTFTTKIYHPNVGIDGQVCLPIISNENWKPHTKTYQVLEALSVLVNNPDLVEPLRLELADLLTLNSEQFHSKAKEFTLQFGEPRPS
ncbi:ubiquitin/ISG15-conjugating enzyme E2 L6 isoform X1 [Myotis lucifugus]|uniref:ubiquitin/ISG15-conjugating enzyme E2 L6 isoform X1 n=1 Tax=Myotis lucifugus TaxID=59463 RepID=UPI000CCC49B0|nr:ubiquitin/ISG15-conjugating enzyme E2 L6 isoform X1 [Myotis lucifugus]